MFGLSYINTSLSGNIRLYIGLIAFLVLNIINVNAQNGNKIKTKIDCIVIDAGHGGKDPGTKNGKIYEKNIALSIALKLGNYIKDNMPDVKVVYTRDKDVFVPLDERAEIANKNQADVFISIHCNANPNKSPFGTETYAMGLTKTSGNLEVAKQENAAIFFEENSESKYQGFDNSPESYIMLSLMQNKHMDQSIKLASLIQNQFKERANRVDRGVKQAGFIVLWKTTMPSVLIETGFLSNAAECKYLNSASGQDFLASAIYRAFKDYKNMIENNSAYTYNKSLEIPKDSASPEIVIDTFPEVEEEKPEEKKPSSAPADSTKHESYFMVQICSSLKPLPLTSKVFKGVKNISEFKVDQRYKYTVGQKRSYKEVLEYLNTMKKLFPDAFLVGCIDGKIVPAKEVMNQIKAVN